MQTYVQAFYSPSTWTQAAVLYQMDDAALTAERQALELTLDEVGVRLDTLPAASLLPAVVEVTGDLPGLLQNRVIQLATDGALSSTLHGCEVFMCSPQPSVVVKASISYVSLYSYLAVPEQMARLLEAWLLAG